ncbi:MAG: phage capsid protein [Peptostreptococcaceae bacterium]
MAVDNFKPTLWEGALLANFHSISKADALSTKPTDIKGKTVTFNRIGAGQVKDYTGTIAWDNITTTPIEMTFDKKKYFAFSLDDCDKVQLKADVMSATTAEHAAVLAETYDTDFFTTLIAGVKSGNSIGSASSKRQLNPRNVYDYIVDLGTVLANNKVPSSDRFVTVSADILGLLSKDPRFTSNPNVLANGVVEGQRINGMQVVQSQELPANKLVAHHKSAIGAAKQIDEVEAMRLQTAFADGIRGLCMYGSKVLREEAIAVLHYTVGTVDDIPPTKVEITNTTSNPVNTKAVV